MSITFLTPILITVICACTAVYAIIGYRSGLVKSALNLAANVAAAFLGAAFSVLTVAMFKKSIIGTVSKIEVYVSLKDSMGSFAGIADFIACMIASAVLFVPMFILMLGVFKAVVSYVYKKKMGRDKADTSQYVSENATFFELHDKKIGAAIGVFCGFFVAVALMSPITGAFRSLDKSIGLARDLLGDKALENVEDLDEIEKYSDDFMVVMADACGGGTFFDIATSASVDGKMTNLSSELRTLSKIGSDGYIQTLKETKSLDSIDTQKIEEMLELIDKAPILKNAVITCMKDASETWLNRGSYMGVSRPEIIDNDIADKFFDEILKVLTTSTVKTLDKDVKTFLGIREIFKENKDLLNSSDTTALMDALASGGITEKIKNELNQNPHMLPVVQVIDDMLMRVVADEISNFDRFTFEDREHLFRQIADILTDTSDINDTARKGVILDEINDAFTDYGTYMSDDMADKIASMLITEIPEYNGAVTVDAVREYFDSLLSN